MPEDIKSYVFDFTTEVERLRNSFPRLRDSTWFFEVDIVRRNTRIRSEQRINYLQVISPVPPPDVPEETIKALQETLLDMAKEHIEERYRSGGNASSYAFHHKPSSLSLVCLRKEETTTASFGSEFSDMMRIFTLYHEASHILSGDDSLDPTKVPLESRDDAFAALHILQRFGGDARGLLSMISWMWVVDFITSNSGRHLSTTTLDKIIYDSTDQDFSRLTPDKIAERANYYADNFTPSPSRVARAVNFFSDLQRDIPNVFSTALKANDPLVFYIGAKGLYPFLLPDGNVLRAASGAFDTKTRAVLGTMIEERASHIDFEQMLHDDTTALFIKNAASITEDPASRYIPLHIPRGFFLQL